MRFEDENAPMTTTTTDGEPRTMQKLPSLRFLANENAEESQGNVKLTPFSSSSAPEFFCGGNEAEKTVKVPPLSTSATPEVFHDVRDPEGDVKVLPFSSPSSLDLKSSEKVPPFSSEKTLDADERDLDLGENAKMPPFPSSPPPNVDDRVGHQEINAKLPPLPSFPTPSANGDRFGPETKLKTLPCSSSSDPNAYGRGPERKEKGELLSALEPLSGVLVVVVDGNEKKDMETVCRICHLGADFGPELLQIGCACKGELGCAHRHCAEAWFRVKGNRCCEICGSNAKNVNGEGYVSFMESWREVRMLRRNNRNLNEQRRCWSGQPCCNFLMACLVIAFILPWFFRVNIFD